VDSKGNTVDFLLTSKRDKKVAKRFFNRALKSKNNLTPRVITIDKSGANLSANNNLKIRQNKYLNNIKVQDLIL
jgi:transposase-like protein